MADSGQITSLSYYGVDYFIINMNKTFCYSEVIIHIHVQQQIVRLFSNYYRCDLKKKRILLYQRIIS